MATRYATFHLTSVSSTQDAARKRLEQRPVLVVAGAQAQGRGRSGRRWLEADRALFASLALRPSWPEQSWPRLSLVSALAAREALGGAVGLKWPNDLHDADGAKVGGLLAEVHRDGIVVLGLGVNLWWVQAPAGMAGLRGEDPGPDAPARLGAKWVDAFLTRTDRGPDDWGWDEYRAACDTIGTRITWDPGGSGLAVDVDRDGSLVVDTGHGTERLSSGEVRHVRAASLAPSPKTTRR